MDLSTLQFLLSPVLSEECFNTFLVDYNFTDVPCLKYGVSKGLGLVIILGSVLVKLPQILKLLKSQSAAGISIIGVMLELFAMSSNLSYSYCKGFPFSAWGEVSFMAIQTSIIAALVLQFNYKNLMLPTGFIAAYGALMASLLSPSVTPIDLLWSMQAANVPIIITSRMIQAWTNVRNGSTGQLSAVTVFMLFFGSTARIFTSIQETGDAIIIFTYATASTCNAIIAFQMLYYWNSDKLASSVGKKNSKKAANKTLSSKTGGSPVVPNGLNTSPNKPQSKNKKHK